MIETLISLFCAFFIHELGHIVIALLFGVHVKKLGWGLWGPYTRRERASSFRVDVLITFAGPTGEPSVCFHSCSVALLGSSQPCIRRLQSAAISRI